VEAVLPKRFGKYGLGLHPEKTRLIDFREDATPRDQPTGRASERSICWASPTTGRSISAGIG
jgi:hypothetical protein